MARELDALTRERAILCELLIGRFLREHAQGALDVAIECERLGAPPATVEGAVERAVNLELWALRSERGQVLWGGRVNRDGQSPEDP